MPAIQRDNEMGLMSKARWLWTGDVTNARNEFRQYNRPNLVRGDGIDAHRHRTRQRDRDVRNSNATPMTTSTSEIRCARVSGPTMRRLTLMNSIANRVDPARMK